MSYSGITVPIPLGDAGLRTDDAQTSIPPNSLIEALNINLFTNQISKAAGSKKLNSTALPDKVIGLHDWHPDSSTQRLIAATDQGSVYRDTGDYTFNSNTAIKTGLGVISNSAKFLDCGLETAGASKKLMLFTGTNQLQVLAADGTSFADVATPAADWTSNYPTSGILHNGRVVAWGNSNDPHRFYMSETGDHEDFAGGGALTFSVFPGEGEGLISAAVYNGRLFLVKSPVGVYFLDDSSATIAEWSIRKVNGSYGTNSNHGIVQALNDVFVGNATGSITSVSATDRFGDVESGDVLSILRIEDHIRNTFKTSAVSAMQSIYYQEKKQLFFTYQSKSGTTQDRMLVLDMAKQSPRAYIYDKDQPSCITLRKDTDTIGRPIYGNDSGFIYQIDNEVTRDVGGAAYSGKFQTPHIDFSFADPSLASKVKIFQFLEVVFEPTGGWDISVDVYIDDEFVETITFPQTLGNPLDVFVLDVDSFTGNSPQALRKPLHGAGRRISFLVKNENVDEDFKIQALNVSFKVSGEQQSGFANT